MLPIETPWVPEGIVRTEMCYVWDLEAGGIPLHHRFLTKTLVVFGFGLKQSSPMLTRQLVTVRPSTLYESQPSVFLGMFWSKIPLAKKLTIQSAGGTYGGKPGWLTLPQ
jgi:hypothetical protein